MSLVCQLYSIPSLPSHQAIGRRHEPSRQLGPKLLSPAVLCGDLSCVTLQVTSLLFLDLPLFLLPLRVHVKAFLLCKSVAYEMCLVHSHFPFVDFVFIRSIICSDDSFSLVMVLGPPIRRMFLGYMSINACVLFLFDTVILRLPAHV